MGHVVRFCLIGLYTVFWGPLALVASALDRSGEAVRWVGRQWIRWIFGTCGVRVEVEGLEGIDPSRAHVFMSNHQSVLDIGAIMLTLPGVWRFVAKRELIWVPFFGWAVWASRQIIIDRSNHEKAVASLRRAAERVRAGESVIIFPEGTRSESGGMRPFKQGGFHLALQAGVPIVPVTVSGSRRLVPRRSLRIDGGTLKIVYGEPIPTAGVAVEDRKLLIDRVRRAIEAGFDPVLQNAS